MPLPVPPPPPRPGRSTPDEVWGGEQHPPGLAGGLREATAVLLTAGRLLARHGPVLLVLFLAGVLTHELVMRAAVRVSLVNAELGMLVLVLAPMATLAALVLMLRTVRPSLPWLSAAGQPPAPVLEHLGSVLVPFLTIYYVENYLNEDALAYSARITNEDVGRQLAQIGAAQPETIDFTARQIFDVTSTLLAVVLIAMVARWALSRWRATQRHPWLGIPGAYLELVWLTLAYVAFLEISDRILQWGAQRRVVQGGHAVWEQAVGTLAGLVSPTQGIVDWLTAHSGQVSTVLVAPLAWLAVGAVVLGQQPARALAGITDRGAGLLLYTHASRWWSTAPWAVRWVATRVTADLRGRFTPLVLGMRMLLRGGITPMLLFCVAFAAARAVEDWLWELQRWVIGGQDPAMVWAPLAWPLGQLNRAVSYTLMICLLAAAVDRSLRGQSVDTGNRA